jgi:hypothetical protein
MAVKRFILLGVFTFILQAAFMAVKYAQVD